MFLVLLCIALSNVALGYFIGVMLLRPVSSSVGVVAAVATLEEASELTVVEGDRNEQPLSNKPSPETILTTTSAKHVAAAANSKCWETACTDIRQDIATLYDRIRYSYTANDKQLARRIASELQTRIPLWQKLLEDKLAAFMAQLEHKPTAKDDCAASELCLSQTETLQTNLSLLDWSDTTDSILKKLEREIEAVKHLLPALS